MAGYKTGAGGREEKGRTGKGEFSSNPVRLSPKEVSEARSRYARAAWGMDAGELRRMHCFFHLSEAEHGAGETMVLWAGAGRGGPGAPIRGVPWPPRGRR